QPVNGESRSFLWQPAVDAGDARDVHVFRFSMDHVAEYQCADLLRINPCALDCLAHDLRRQFRGWHILQRAAVTTDRGAHAAHYDHFTSYIAHDFPLPIRLNFRKPSLTLRATGITLGSQRLFDAAIEPVTFDIIAGARAFPDFAPRAGWRAFDARVALYQQQPAVAAACRHLLTVGDDVGEIFEHRTLRLAEITTFNAAVFRWQRLLHAGDHRAVALAGVDPADEQYRGQPPQHGDRRCPRDDRPARTAFEPHQQHDPCNRVEHANRERQPFETGRVAGLQCVQVFMQIRRNAEFERGPIEPRDDHEKTAAHHAEPVNQVGRAAPQRIGRWCCQQR